MRGLRATRRRVVIGVIGTAAGLATLVAAPARGQDAEVAPAFTPGSGLATATAVNPVIAAGNLQISVVAGQAIASYRDRTAAGTSTLVDVPILRSVGGTEVCGTTPTSLALPAPLIADTGPKGDTEPVAVSASGDGTGFVQRAAAQPGAHGEAASGLGVVQLPPVVSVLGADLRADVRADTPAQRRTATARSTIGEVRLLGGLITLEGLRWEVSQTYQGPDHRSRTAEVSRRFELGGIAIGLPGLPLTRLPVASADQLRPVVDQANALLGPLGVELRLPVDESDPAAGIEGITPLTVALGGRDFLLGPVLGGLFTHPAFQELTSAVLESAFDPAACQQLAGLMQALGPKLNATYNQLGGMAPLLVAVITGALGGTGEVQLNIGGASTRLDDTYFEPPAFAPPALGGSSPGLDVPAVPGRPATPPAPPALPTPTPSPVPAPQSELVSSTRCQTTSPAGRPGCWLGRAQAAGAMALVVTVGLLAADEVVRRRRSASAPPQEVRS